jgi:hypothetical protein
MAWREKEGLLHFMFYNDDRGMDGKVRDGG